MGCLSCNRKGCMNIMCSRISDRYGYICQECLDELRSNPTFDIESFMNSAKDDIPNHVRETQLEFIEREFRKQD